MSSALFIFLLLSIFFTSTTTTTLFVNADCSDYDDSQSQCLMNSCSYCSAGCCLEHEPGSSTGDECECPGNSILIWVLSVIGGIMLCMCCGMFSWYFCGAGRDNRRRGRGDPDEGCCSWLFGNRNNNNNARRNNQENENGGDPANPNNNNNRRAALELIMDQLRNQHQIQNQNNQHQGPGTIMIFVGPDGRQHQVFVPSGSNFAEPPTTTTDEMMTNFTPTVQDGTMGGENAAIEGTVVVGGDQDQEGTGNRLQHPPPQQRPEHQHQLMIDDNDEYDNGNNNNNDSSRSNMRTVHVQPPPGLGYQRPTTSINASQSENNNTNNNQASTATNSLMSAVTDKTAV